MGLARRIIPTLLARGEQLVKGKRFDSWRSVGHVLQAARVHAARGVDELIVLDIAATPEGRGPNLALVEKICESMFTPVTVGGGVRSLQDVRDLLNAGADKVAIGSAAYEREALLVLRASDRFGSQAIAVAIDYREHSYGHVTASEGGRKVQGWGPDNWARKVYNAGAGEILLTSIDREGTTAGFDLRTIAHVAGAVDIPVIAHGGCGTYEHMHQALEVGASAVAAGAMFQFTDQTPRGAARYLAAHGVETRQ